MLELVVMSVRDSSCQLVRKLSLCGHQTLSRLADRLAGGQARSSRPSDTPRAK